MPRLHATTTRFTTRHGWTLPFAPTIFSTWSLNGEDVEVYAGDDAHGHLRGATAHLEGNAEVVAHDGFVYATDRASVWNDDEKTKIHSTRHEASERIIPVLILSVIPWGTGGVS